MVVYYILYVSLTIIYLFLNEDQKSIQCCVINIFWKF